MLLPVFKKGMTLRFDDAASEHFDDHLGKKCQESTKTKKIDIKNDISSIQLARHKHLEK